MAESQAQIPLAGFSIEAIAGTTAVVPREARERALVAGQTVTTHKDGRLVQEKMVSGKLIELFNEARERDTD